MGNNLKMFLKIVLKNNLDFVWFYFLKIFLRKDLELSRKLINFASVKQNEKRFLCLDVN